MLVEPPGPVVSAGPEARGIVSPLPTISARELLQLTAGASRVRLAAGAGATVMAASSTGDVLVLGVLLGVAAGDLVAGVAGVLAGLAVVIRLGSPSLEAMAGAQSVLGAAGWVEPAMAAASAWAAAFAILARLPSVAALPAGLAAAALVAGPGPGGAIWLRVAASVIAVALAWLGARLPRRPAAVAALTLGTAACVLAAAS